MPGRLWSQCSSGTFLEIENDEKQNTCVKQVISMWNENAVLKDGHYEMMIPFKSRIADLSNNYRVAESRIDSLQRKLQRDTNLYQKLMVFYSGC